MGAMKSFEAKAYYKVGGVGGIGSWLELTNIRDLTQSGEVDTPDITVRGSGGFKVYDSTLIDASVEFEMVYDPDDAAFTALQDAFQGRNLIGLKFLDEADGHGLVADWIVAKFTREEKIADDLTVSVSVKPAYSANPPEWV